MLPLYLLTSAKNQPILVELKNGETLNGLLTNLDSWMNLTLSDVVQTSPSGDEFTKIPEIYIRGNHVKYMRLPEQTMDYAKEQSLINMQERNKNKGRRGNQNGGNFGNNHYNNRRGNNHRGGYNNHHNNRGDSRGESRGDRRGHQSAGDN